MSASSLSAETPLQVDDAAQVIDAGGRVVLPGLIDAHVHVVASSHDLSGLALQPPSLVSAESSRILRDMLHRGFTTVRDAAGADFGLQEAVARGLFEGPRLFIAGFPISQTGGHADMRPKGVRPREFFCTCAGLGLIGAIADGVGEVRRAVREQVRNGANQIKIMAGGSISSPSDPLEGTQFSHGRTARRLRGSRGRQPLRHGACLLAAGGDARGAGGGTLHRARQPDRRGQCAGDEGAWRLPLVPTLATYVALADEGERLGWSADDAGQASPWSAHGASSH